MLNGRITNDPDRPDDAEYVVQLLAQVIEVNLKTAKIVANLPPLTARQA